MQTERLDLGPITEGDDYTQTVTFTDDDGLEKMNDRLDTLEDDLENN